MAPIVHFVRHAQGVHNLGPSYWTVIDPALTTKGIEQCHQLQRDFPHHGKIDLIVASPLRRTIYTALHGFEPVLSAHPGRKILALPDLQEITDFPSDVGSELEVLREEVREKNLPVDLGCVGVDWEKKTGRFTPTAEAISLRCRDVRCWLRERPEKEIVLVSHGGLMHFLTEDWENGAKETGTGWSNTEYRSYTFVDDVYNDLAGADFGGKNASLIETKESRLRRGLSDTPPTRAEQIELYKLGRKGWEDQGLCLNSNELQLKNAAVEVTEKEDVESA